VRFDEHHFSNFNTIVYACPAREQQVADFRPEQPPFQTFMFGQKELGVARKRAQSVFK